jgi:hypothetical protein
MTDWSASMQQTFEYYVVDPVTWRDTKRIDTVRSCTIERDASSDTLGSATFTTTESLGECYVRVYLIAIQNGIREKVPLGTFLIQSPSTTFDGKVDSISTDAYTPLLELKENPTPLGYSLLKGERIMDRAYQITREQARAPVVGAEDEETLFDDFVSNTDDTWILFLKDLIANAKYEYALDEMGRILFAPVQETASMQPVWTYTDDNSSILYPEVTLDKDLYGIPNVVEVIYSNGSDYYYARVVNDDSNSPTSTINRGREILYRDTNPSLSGDPTRAQIKEYAERLLKSLSSIECTLSYTHGYCPVRLGDCVRFNYAKAGLTDIKAKVIHQSMVCTPGCQVTEKAIFTTKLWR